MALHSLSVQRLRSLQQKKEAQAKATRRDIATLLERGKVETARIKTEAGTSALSPSALRRHLWQGCRLIRLDLRLPTLARIPCFIHLLTARPVINEDIYMELLELLELYCELVHVRFGILDQK